MTEPAVRYVSERKIREHSGEIHLHLEDCPHWYTEVVRRVENTADPELRRETETELALMPDERGPRWRKCKDHVRRASS